MPFHVIARDPKTGEEFPRFTNLPYYGEITIYLASPQGRAYFEDARERGHEIVVTDEYGIIHRRYVWYTPPPPLKTGRWMLTMKGIGGN